MSQGTPPLMVHRLLVALAATDKANRRDYDMLIARYDVSVAFCHAESSMQNQAVALESSLLVVCMRMMM